MEGKERPDRRGPALGALDGVRRDIQAAKDAGVAYDPRGAGSAWSHDFLNKKPWHPMNFRNQAKVWEAEQRHLEDERRKQLAREEFAAEQEYLKTVSMLSAEEQEKYKQRQSVSWLYMKPPGYDAAADKAGQVAPGGSKGPPQEQGNGHDARAPPRNGGSNAPPGQRMRQNGGNHIARVVGGVQAVVKQQLQLKRGLGMAGGRSPPRGGVDPSAENQRFVVPEMESEEEEEAYRLAMMSEEERRQRRQEAAKEQRRQQKELERRKAETERQRVEEAKAFLRAAGLAVPDELSSGSDGDGSGSESREGRARKVEQKRKRRKKEEKRRSKKKRGRVQE